VSVYGLPVAIGPALNTGQIKLKYLLLVEIVFLGKIVGEA